MCYSRANNDKINRIHRNCLRIIYSEKDGSASVRNRNLHILATEMYKTKNDLSPLIVTELFEHRNEQHYDLSKNSVHYTSNKNSVSWVGKYLIPRT